MDGTVLIADDDRTIRTVLTQAMTRAGCRVHATGSLDQLMRWVHEGRGDLVITDVMMPDGNGIDLIPQILQLRPQLPVIVISAQNTIVTAIRATEADAFDYLPKPFDLPDLLARAGQALSRPLRKSEPPRTAATPPTRPDAPAIPLIGHAPAMQQLFRKVARVLKTDLAVMISGQSGVGRSLLARVLHDLSDRGSAGFAMLTPADSSEPAIQAAVAAAQGGTLLIEDPAGLDATAQARLIGLIEGWEQSPNRKLPLRLLSTVGPHPQSDIEQGRLRADLYYRLAGTVLTVPPLLARIDDIPALARHFLTRAAQQGLPERALEDDAAALIRAYPFPGNLRELDNLIRGFLMDGAKGAITADEVRAALAERTPDTQAPPPPVGHRAQAAPMVDPFAPAAAQVAPAAAGGPLAPSRLAQSIEVQLQRYFDLHGDHLPPPGLYDRILHEVERPLLQVALDATGGNQLRCAELLGINRNTLRKKLTDLKIEVTRRRKLM